MACGRPRPQSPGVSPGDHPVVGYANRAAGRDARAPWLRATFSQREKGSRRVALSRWERVALSDSERSRGGVEGPGEGVMEAAGGCAGVRVAGGHAQTAVGILALI